MADKPLQNGFPGKNSVVRSRVWFASGTTASKMEVVGSILKDGKELFKGTTIRHSSIKRRKSDKSKYYRWIVCFDGDLAKGAYLLNVADKATGKVIDSREFQVVISFDVKITSHSNGENITDEADGFVAFGTLKDWSIESAAMNTVPADFVEEFWDNGTGTWVAMFPYLEDDTYTLLVTDFGAFTDRRTGLVVDRTA